MEKIYSSNCSNDTFNIGVLIGTALKKGDFISVDGDLGAGKTVLVKGIAKGAGIIDDICSPTYTFVNEYHGPIDFYHFDMYRINEISEVYELGFFEYISPNSVCVVEWGNRIKGLLPKNRIDILIKKDMDIDDEYREIRVLTEDA